MLNLDTHILVHSLSGSLTIGEQELITRSSCGISAIVIWEIAMLWQRGRIAIDLDSAIFSDALSRLQVWPVDVPVCRRLRDLDFASDPADEIIAATSLAHGVQLLTRDRRMRQSKVIPLAR
jgi:PIN domain nuclease of toxin-antitoxin system